MFSHIKLFHLVSQRNIPVMEKEGLEFLIQTFNEHQCHRCLEIGSAIGYSAMMMVSNIDDFVVETIELDDARYLEAIQNIKEQQLEDQKSSHENLDYQQCKFHFFELKACIFQRIFDIALSLHQ